MMQWIEQIQYRFERLSARDKNVALFGGVAGIIVLCIVAVLLLNASLSRIQTRITEKENTLRDIADLKEQYGQLKSKTDSLMTLLADKNDIISSMLDKEAGAMGLRLESVKEVNSPSEELYDEKRVEVKVENTNLSQMVDFFYKIESNRKLMRIGNVSVSRRNDSKVGLDVTFTVSLFQKKDV